MCFVFVVVLGEGDECEGEREGYGVVCCGVFCRCDGGVVGEVGCVPCEGLVVVFHCGRGGRVGWRIGLGVVVSGFVVLVVVGGVFVDGGVVGWFGVVRRRCVGGRGCGCR